MQALHKVLVVDDDAVVGRSLDRVLSEKGYAVSTALNGQEALNKFAGENHDVIVTDMRMPGMDGIEFAERIKAKSPWTPVVMLTGYGTPDCEARAAAVGITDFLHKPLLPEVIEEVIDKITRKSVVIEEKVPALAAETKKELTGIALFLKNVALFLAAPFIGLAYFIAFPFIGLGMLCWYGLSALLRRFRSK